jgi:serine-type D-Ala-D-Ala carboxypeptidase/endopeptidase (penicillin-binding protein 4)
VSPKFADALRRARFRRVMVCALTISGTSSLCVGSSVLAAVVSQVVSVGQPPVTGVDGGVSATSIPAISNTQPTTTVAPGATIPISPGSDAPIGVNDPVASFPGSSTIAPVQAGVGTVPAVPAPPPVVTPPSEVLSPTVSPPASSPPSTPTVAAVVGVVAPRTPAELRAAVIAALGLSTSKSKSVVVVLEGAGAVVELDGDTPRTPASTQKIYVAGTILSRLGGDHRFTTEARSTTIVDGAGVVGELVLRASGDPSFSAARLTELADAVAKSGVKQVSTGLVIDDSRFDTKTRIDIWKPSFTPGEVGVLSAFTIDQNHRFDKLTATDPGMANLSRFRSALVAKGIAVGAGSRRGLLRDGGPILGSVRSDPLRDLVRTMLKKSDNTYAEMFTKELGAQDGNGSTSGGVAVIAAHMVAMGASRPIAQFDGSGLSSQNRSTARQQVEFLRRSAGAPYGADFVGGLPVACVDGTLKNRLCKTAGASRVQAKTGALDFVVGLAGYGITANGRTVTFSFLLNDVRSANSARASIDKAVAAIASSTL